MTPAATERPERRRAEPASGGHASGQRRAGGGRARPGCPRRRGRGGGAGPGGVPQPGARSGTHRRDLCPGRGRRAGGGAAGRGAARLRRRPAPTSCAGVSRSKPRSAVARAGAGDGRRRDTHWERSAPAALPVLIDLLRDDSEWARVNAAFALGEMDSGGPRRGSRRWRRALDDRVTLRGAHRGGRTGRQSVRPTAAGSLGALLHAGTPRLGRTPDTRLVSPGPGAGQCGHRAGAPRQRCRRCRGRP